MIHDNTPAADNRGRAFKDLEVEVKTWLEGFCRNRERIRLMTAQRAISRDGKTGTTVKPSFLPTMVMIAS